MKQTNNTQTNKQIMTTETVSSSDCRQRYAEIFLSDSGDEFAIVCLCCTEVFFRYGKWKNHMRKEHDLPPHDRSDYIQYNESIEELIIYESDEDDEFSIISSQPEHDYLSENLGNITIMSNINDNGSLSSEINEIINSVAYVGVSEDVEYENGGGNIEKAQIMSTNAVQQQHALIYSYQRNQSQCTDDDDEDDQLENKEQKELQQQQHKQGDCNGNNECIQGPNLVSNFNIFDDINDCGILLDKALLIGDSLASTPNKPTELCNTQDPPSSNILLEDLKSSFSVYDRLVDYGNISNVSEDDDDIRRDNHRITPKMILDDADDDDSDLDDKLLLVKNRLPLMNNKLMLWKFIEAYKMHQCLWRTDHPCYRDRSVRQQAYQNIQETMHKKHNFLMSEQQVARKISMLRNSYQRELDKKVKFDKARLPNSTDEYLSKLWYFNQMSFIEDHITITMKSGEKRTSSDTLKCDICERTCLSAQSLKVHQKMCHSTFKPFECSVCQKRFRFRANMLSHQSTHSKVDHRHPPYTCEYCGIKMSHRQNFQTHLRRHTKEYPYHCKECGQGVASSIELKSHILNHATDKPFVCDICCYSFKNHGCLNRHLKRHYKIYEHKCDICGKEFVLRSRLNEHMKIHGENNKDYICDSCGKTFVTNKHLKQHMQLHNNETKGYLCSMAPSAATAAASGNNFNQQQNILAHLTLHNPPSATDKLDVEK